MKQSTAQRNNAQEWHPARSNPATKDAPLWDCRVKLPSGTISVVTVAAHRIRDAHKTVATLLGPDGIIQEITAHVPAPPMRNPCLDANRLRYTDICKLVAIVDPIKRLDGPVQVAA